MELTDGIRSRRSIRKFREEKVDRELLMQTAADASFAPSWKNSQPVRYLITDDEKLIRRLAGEKCMQGFRFNMENLAKAPAVVIQTVVTGLSGYKKDGSFSTSKGSHWESFDAGIAAQTFCLAAWERGLGTVIMGLFDEKEIARVIEVPQGQKITAVIAVGYPEVCPEAPKRKSPEELVTFL